MDRLAAPELVNVPLIERSLAPLIVALPPHTTLLEIVPAPPVAWMIVDPLLPRVNVPPPSALLLPICNVPLFSEVPPLYRLVPFNWTVPAPGKFRVMPVPETIPFTTSVPPAA